MNKKLLLALLTSFIGNHFYILFVSLILLKIGYSSSFVSFAIGATIIPNLFLGPMLGKLVDRSSKVKLHTILCAFLAVIVISLGYFSFNLDLEVGKYVIIFLMVAYNCFMSPLNTLLYQYIVPSLDENESKAYIVWERYEALGIFLASSVGFVLMKQGLEKWLLAFDAVSFIICALIVHGSWGGGW